MGQSILIMDDPENGALIRQILESTDFGYKCECLATIENWKVLLRAKVFDTLLVNKDYFAENILKTVKQIKLEHRHIRVVMIAEEIDSQEVLVAREHYVDEFCMREDYSGLVNAIEGVLE